MKVDRCVCMTMSFEQLKAVAAEKGVDFNGLKEATGCCSSCKMCEPYIRRMLETGETAFILDRKHPAPVAGRTTVVGGTVVGLNLGGVGLGGDGKRA
jgi:bacterioferritin-associated ferredoxin